MFDEQSVLPDFMNAPHGEAVSIDKNKSVREKRTNGFSIAGFVLTILGYTVPFGLIFSVIGLVKSKTYENGGGLAIAGTVICGCAIIAFTIFMIFMILDYLDIVNV